MTGAGERARMGGRGRGARHLAGVLGLALAGALAACGGGSPGRGGEVWLRDRGPAVEPFGTLTAGVVRVGDQDLRVVVADDPASRSTGLRGREDAAPYDGMLFVFDADTRAAFTMAGVTGALDIGFYSADGAAVGRLRMEPCAGTDATCPLYRVGREFRYALETAAGALPRGRLAVR